MDLGTMNDLGIVKILGSVQGDLILPNKCLGPNKLARPRLL